MQGISEVVIPEGVVDMHDLPDEAILRMVTINDDLLQKHVPDAIVLSRSFG